MDGTTKIKRRTKKEIEAQILQEQEEGASRKKQEQRLQQLLGETGVILHVRAKDGNKVVRHRVAITKKGQALFVDHGMCSPGAMIAEMELGGYSVAHILKCDVCFVMAIFLACPKHPYVRHIPSQSERGTHLHMTEKLKELYSEDAYKFICGLKEKRTLRLRIQLELRNIQMRPFCNTVSARTRSIAEQQYRTVLAKIDRVRARLANAGYKEDFSTYGYRAGPGILPP